jgi:iron complex outermembrane receptor protein
MAKIYKKSVLLSLAVAVAAGQGRAAETEMAEVLVIGEKLVTPTMQASETVYTGSEITPKGIEIQGVKATTSVYGTLDMLPGINVESADSSGLAAETGSIRVRGVRSSMGAMTVEGVPNYGGNPIGPRDYLYDLENMRGVSMYKGAVPGDIGTGVGSRGGAIELRPDWPDGQFGLHFKQGLGSNSYARSYFRVDSPQLPEIGTSASAAFSYSEADKWRGPGTLGPRKNVNLSLNQPLGDKADIKLWYNHNDLDQHLYRSLSWADIQDLSANYDKDYNACLTGDAAQDIHYYDYNRGEYQNDDILAVMTMQVTDALRLTAKPYHTEEDTHILQGSTSSGGSVRKRNRDITKSGLIGEAMLKRGAIKATFGYHFEDGEMNIFTQNYAMTDSGLDYRGYGRMSASEGSNYLNSPYFKLAGSHGSWDWQAGLKYFHYEESASQGYVSGPGPDYALRRAPDLDRSGSTLDIWLPTAGAAWRFSEALEAHASYGRTFIRPYAYMPLHSIYLGNRTAFQAQGISLQNLFDGYDFERANIIDFGLRWTTERFEISPTFFYGKHENLLTTVYDPRVNLNYQQNVGKATGLGLDMEINAYLDNGLTVFFNPTYTSMTYDNDLTFAGKTRSTKDNQVIDTPEWMLKTGLIWNWRQFEIVPMLRYIGARYVDAENNNEVDSAFVADLRTSWTMPDVLRSKEAKLSLELNNLFDKEYISSINGWDDSRNGQASFYQGAPFAAMLTFSLRY